MVGNFLNFIIIRKLSAVVDMGEASKVVHLALSVADFITRLALFIGKLTDERIIPDGAENLCKVVGFLMTCAPGTSAIFILLVNTDRFIAIARPFVYHSVVTKRRVVYTCRRAVSFVCLSRRVFIIYAVVHDQSLAVIRYHRSLGICKVAFPGEHSFLPYTLGAFLLNMWPVAILLAVLYCKIIRISINHASIIREHEKIAQRLKSNKVEREGTDGHSLENGKNDIYRNFKNGFQRNLRTLRTPVLITGFYLLAWIPFSVMETFISATQDTYLLESPIYIAVASLAACNCSVNLFVYYISRKDFRKKFKYVLLRRRFMNTSSILPQRTGLSQS